MKAQIDKNGFRRAIAAHLQACPEGRQFAVLVLVVQEAHRLEVLFGYDRAEQVLVALGNSCAAALKKATNVTRIGDATIAMVIPNLSAANLVVIALERLLDTARAPQAVGDREIRLEVRAGAAVFPQHGRNDGELLLNAESALQAACASGEPYRLHNSLAIEATLDEWALQGDLGRALPERQLQMFYQPQLRLANRRLSGCEALMRWQHPQRGMVSPDRFIPLAESRGLIDDFTEWALQTALRETVADSGGSLAVSVNVSAPTLFHAEFPLIVESALSIWDVPAQNLVVEITESVLMRDPASCRKILSTLRDRGIRISIDDFGTGYSSLAYFKAIPADELKIDRSFVATMCEDVDDAHIVEVIINLAHKFGLEVVAEGVEDEATLTALTVMGCDIAQGYYVSRPLSHEDFLRWLTDSKYHVAADGIDSQ